MPRKTGVLETSCGFILINFDSVLLLQYPLGHWSFPKGHVEEGDSDHHSTAVRELTEETGISQVSIFDGWSKRFWLWTMDTRRSRQKKKKIDIFSSARLGLALGVDFRAMLVPF